MYGDILSPLLIPNAFKTRAVDSTGYRSDERNIF
jgi:hypothetical protein